MKNCLIDVSYGMVKFVIVVFPYHTHLLFLNSSHPPFNIYFFSVICFIITFQYIHLKLQVPGNLQNISCFYYRKKQSCHSLNVCVMVSKEYYSIVYDATVYICPN